MGTAVLWNILLSDLYLYILRTLNIFLKSFTLYVSRSLILFINRILYFWKKLWRETVYYLKPLLFIPNYKMISIFFFNKNLFYNVREEIYLFILIIFFLSSGGIISFHYFSKRINLIWKGFQNLQSKMHTYDKKQTITDYFNN